LAARLPASPFQPSAAIDRGSPIQPGMKVLNLVTVLALLSAYATAGVVAWDVSSGRDPWSDRPAALKVCFDAFWILTMLLMWVQLATTQHFTQVEKQFVFYASYHNSFPNQLIHFCFVWPILVTAIMFLTWVTCATVAVAGCTVHLPSLAFALVYAVYYLCLERPVGVAAAVFVMLAWASAEVLKRDHGLHLAPVVFGVHLASWVAQFVGHGVFEGRAPALLDNLAQSFFMAPLFVLLEALSWCGYKRVLFADMKGRVRRNIDIFKQGGSVSVSGDGGEPLLG